MSPRIHPALAAALLLLFGSLLYASFWASGKSLGFAGPDHMHTDPSGNVFIKISNSLLQYDPDSQFLKKYELRDLGIERMAGDFAFFNNGDILLRRGSYNPGFLESIQRFLRQTDTTPEQAPDDESGLFRCDPGTLICARFGDGSIDMNHAFHLFIDPDTEEVYATDTSRHVLRKFNKLGEQIARIDKGFFFPNRILMHNKSLYVADTNHHSIQQVSADTDNFGHIFASQSIRAGAESPDNLQKRQVKARHTWPYNFLPVGNSWWVNNMTNNMRDGGVYIYDSEWNMTDRLFLPADADPAGMAFHNNIVLISDITNHKIYRFDTDGQRLDEFSSDEFDSVVSHSLAQKTWYQTLANYLLYTFFGLLLAGFILALKRSIPRKKRHAGSIVTSPTPDITTDTVVMPRTVAPYPGISEDLQANVSGNINKLPFKFTGKAGEYFGIWIVNILLIMATAGIYTPWAKVRTKRYFYGNTLLDNSPFDYLADPIAILKGWAIGVGLFAVYSVITNLIPLTSIIFMLLFFIALPWLVLRSLAFRMHNTSYRNLRFRFTQRYGEAVRVFIGIGLLVPLTLGLILPSYIYRQKKFIIENSHYGMSGFGFRAAEIKFYEIYGIAILIIMAGGLTFSLMLPALTLLTGGSFPDLTAPGSTGQMPPVGLLVALPVLIITGIGFFYLFAFAWINTKVHNLVWNNTFIADNNFHSTLEVRQMMWLYFSNMLGIMFSFGLLIPWARTRMARYRVTNLALAVKGDLDNYIAAESAQVNAAGEEVGEMFDFDIGL